MSQKNRGINAYRSEISRSRDDGGERTEEKTGFLKLTNEKADYGKIARFLLLLGRDEAVKVLRHLSPGEVKRISEEISRTKRVDKVEAEKLLKEFGFEREREAVRARGGADAASEILTRAFGKEEADRYLRKAVPQVVEGPFSFLNDLEFDQLIMLLKEESPHVIALVLRYLDPALSSKVLDSIDRRISTAIVKRIARGGAVSNEVIKGMEESLKEKIRNQGKVESVEIDGPSALAGILKYMDIDKEHQILNYLEEEDSTMGRSIREKLFTIDTVLHIDRDDLAMVLNDLAERDIALILRVVDDEVKEKIRNSLSSGRKVLVDEENDLAGRVKKSEAEALLKDFLTLLRKKEEEGAFIIIREEDRLI